MPKSKTAIKGTCHFCNNEINAWETAAYPVTGWEGERHSGGANSIIGRIRQPNLVAHLVCVKEGLRNQKSGEIKGQTSLLSD